MDDKKTPKLIVSHLGFYDTLRVGASGLKTRKLRAALSAVGITIGIASLVGILGLSQSGSADLLKNIDALGTNLLTVQAGEGFRSVPVSLPEYAPSMISRIDPVYQVSKTSRVEGGVYINDLIDDGRTQGITIIASDLNLLETQRGTLNSGRYLDGAIKNFPAVVLGSVAAERLGIRKITGKQKLWLGNEWFVAVGILNPLPLAADLDRGAIIGYQSASRFLGHDGETAIVYLRAHTAHVHDVRSVLAATVNPENPEEVQVSRASDALEARVAASNTFINLFVGLGAVALLVGGIGIANVMVIAVMERRNEIGLRRALGATRLHIASQFLTESFLLSGIGGGAGILVGIFVTSIYATTQGWDIVIPMYAIIGGIICSLLIGGLAGLYPSLRAASMPPTEALRTR